MNTYFRYSIELKSPNKGIEVLFSVRKFENKFLRREEEIFKETIEIVSFPLKKLGYSDFHILFLLFMRFNDARLYPRGPGRGMEGFFELENFFCALHYVRKMKKGEIHSIKCSPEETYARLMLGML